MSSRPPNRPPEDVHDRSAADDETGDDPLAWLRHDVREVRTLLRHDGREPLHILSLYGRLLADNPDTATFGRPIVDATEEIRDLFVTIETWLALGPPDAGPADPIALARSAAARRPIALTLPAENLLVAMRPRHLRQALDLLLDLAFSQDDTEVRITIDTLPESDQPMPHARIAITTARPMQLAANAFAIPDRLVTSAGGWLDVQDDDTGWTLVLPRP